MKLTLGFSPCPNDTFIFDALVNHKIDTEGLSFETVLEDVETLNQWALEERLDITKLSFPAFFQVADNYVLLNSGSALGNGVGPLLLTKSAEPISRDEIIQSVIAIPGIHTTANLLLSFAFPEAKIKAPMLFSNIEDAIANGQTDLGVIIHENRFTYQEKGLHKVLDLGEYWEEKMQLPIPLGGIAVSQSVKRSVALKVNQLIRQSIDYAFKNYPVIPDFVKQYSQTMSEMVMRQHIELYVNEYSLDLGEKGKMAIKSLQKIFEKINNREETKNEILFL